MSENLNNGEKEFLEIFRHHKTITNQSISMDDVSAAQRMYEYMSYPNYKDLENIMKSLESKGFIKIENDDQIFLTQLGEDYLWRG